MFVLPKIHRLEVDKGREGLAWREVMRKSMAKMRAWKNAMVIVGWLFV